jgi:hypothetical protein
MSDETVMFWTCLVLLVAVIGFRVDSVFLRRSAVAHRRELEPSLEEPNLRAAGVFVVLTVLLLTVFTIGSFTIG